MTMTSGTALIVVDVQYDFMDGSLAVPDAHAIIKPIEEIAAHYQHVVLTRDYHPADHMSFSDNPEFVDKSWPPHCVEGTEGAMIHPYLSRLFDGAPVFSKGTDSDRETYSGFEGTYYGQSLTDWLDDHNVGRVGVVGLATDYCVLATAMDAAEEYAYETNVYAEAIRGVAPVTTALAIRDMTEAGVWVTTLEAAVEIGI